MSEKRPSSTNYTVMDLRGIHACLDEALRLAEDSGALFAAFAIEDVAADVEQAIDDMKRFDREANS